MIFKESKKKRRLYFLKHPPYRGARRWTLVALLILIVSFVLLKYFAIASIIGGVFTLIFGIKAYKLYGINRYKYDYILTIDGNNTSLSVRGINVDGKEEIITMKMLKFEGVEYYPKTQVIAFLGPVDYGNVVLYGLPTENVYEEDVLDYLKKVGIEVTYIRKGDFDDRWRK